MGVTWSFISLIASYALLMLIFPRSTKAWLLIPISILAWVADWLITRNDPKLTAERSFTKPVTQHQFHEVSITITNPGKRNLEILVKDEPPFESKVITPCSGKLKIFASGSSSLAYQISTAKRGSFNFGAVNIKYSGRLGLFSRSYILPIAQSLDVYPDLVKMGNLNFPQLTASELSGEHRRKIPSLHGELAQLREFIPGDDIRKVNWKVSAHFGKAIINEFEPERDQHVFLCFDTGRMLFDQLNSQYNHLDYILDSGLHLAHNIVTHGDMVGAISFDAEVNRYLPAGKGQHHLQLLVDRCYDLQASLVESDYREAFGFLQKHLNKRCLIFVYTDITDMESSRDLIEYLKNFSRHHLVVSVLLKKEYLDKMAAAQIDDETSAYLKGVALELINERRHLIQCLTLHGIKVLEVDPGNISQTVTEHYLYLKNKGLF